MGRAGLVNDISFRAACSPTRPEDAATDVRTPDRAQPMSWPPTQEDLEAVEVLVLDAPAPTPPPGSAVSPARITAPVALVPRALADSQRPRAADRAGVMPAVLDLDLLDGEDFTTETDRNRRVSGRGAGRGILVGARRLGIAAVIVLALGLAATTVDWPVAVTSLTRPAVTFEAPNAAARGARTDALPSPVDRDASTPPPLPDPPTSPPSHTEAGAAIASAATPAAPTPATSASPAGILRGEAAAPLAGRVPDAGRSLVDTSSVRQVPLPDLTAPASGAVAPASAPVALAAQPPAPPQPRPVPDPVAATLPAAPAALASAPAALLPPDRSLAAAPPPPAARPASPPVSDDVRIQGVLRRYEAAYAQLDARAAQAVWPSVDIRALSRAFEGLESQSVRLGSCQFDVGDTVAHAQCLGSTSYVPRVGSRTPRTELRSWTFRLRKVDEQWEIIAAQIR